MTKILLIPALALLLGACGAPFTAEQDPIGVGQAGEAPLGTAGTPSAADAGSAGLVSAGAPSAAGAAGAGGSETSTGGSGGAAVLAVPPCANAVDTVGPGYLAVARDTCYRIPESEIFDTITCGGGVVSDKDRLSINGQPVVCGQKQTFASPIGGYNYLEITHPSNPTGWVRWFVLQDTVPCANPVDPTRWPMWVESTGSVCLRTTQAFKTVSWSTVDPQTNLSTEVPGRTLTIDGFQEASGATEVGYPPTTDPDRYIYIVVAPGSAAYLDLR